MNDRDLYESEALERAGLDWKAVNHCGSCHDDSDQGYSMNGVTFAADNRDAEVCCEAAYQLDAIDGLTIRPDWWKPRAASQERPQPNTACGSDTSHCRPCYGNGEGCADVDCCSTCDCHRSCTDDD